MRCWVDCDGFKAYCGGTLLDVGSEVWKAARRVLYTSWPCECMLPPAPRRPCSAVDGLMDLVYEDMRVQMIVQRNSITAAPYTLSPRAHAGAALSLPIRYAMNLG